MSTRRVCVMLLLSIAAVQGADKDKGRFAPGPASSYPFKQTIDKLTIAAVPYVTSEQAKTAFGKVNPYEYGVLPVLLVMQNDTGKVLNLERMKVDYVWPNNQHVEATPANDVLYLEGAKRPNFGGSPVPNPLPIPRGPKKSKLNTWEIEGRAFNAKMLPVGEAAHGFVYFQTGHRRGSKIYLSGVREASSGRELFFFEIPLDE